MQPTKIAACALAGLLAVFTLPSLTAHALTPAKAQGSPERGVDLVAQKSREDDTPRRSKSRTQRTSKADEAKDRAPRYGSQAPGSSVPLNARGPYLFSPSFNGAYTPPSGYSLNGYPIRHADEVATAEAECAPLRRRAMSTGQRSAWDRYYACVED